jgi:UDP-sulfoquinovose synthase
VGNRLGLNVEIRPVLNPRLEAEDHYYNPAHTGLLELGLEPHYLTDQVIEDMLNLVLSYKDRINIDAIFKGVKWK